jgi:hypothetical protein
MLPSSLNWDSTHSDSMENQFVTNASAYVLPSGTPVGPMFGLGWRGAYLAPPIGSDPWGRRYLVNSAFLAIATDSCDGGCIEGTALGGWSKDTFCISAGPNSVYETPIAGNDHGGTNRTGDDFIYIISGGTR